MQRTDMAVMLTVGELARRTGVSVRTLHWYEEVGLLCPARDSGSGYRRYGPGDIARLQQIVSLRQLGLSLDEIRYVIDREDGSLRRVIALQLDRLEEQIRLQQTLRDRLRLLAARLSTDDDVSVDDLIDVMEMMMVEKYYTPEQLEWLRQRREEVGEERIREVEAEWPELMAAVRAEMAAGSDPADPQVQALMTRWRALVGEFNGGNPGIERSLQSFYESEDTLPTGEPIDRELFAYVGRAMAAG
jgi:DNA-binding transcriptional MerR regulator